ncbi:MAG TPA: hypothetical protein VLG38_03305 [Gammaproteobacteria bacterium]|nr:hypothetical protein [Gammaproteobacteria bacterium]
MHKFLGIDSYEEWKKKRDDHNEFIINCRLAPVGVESPDPPSPFTPVARPVTAPWEIL